MPRGIVFDFDGVIVDSEPWWDEADRRLVESQGKRLLPGAKKAVIGLKQEVSIRKLMDMHGITADPVEMMRRREAMMEEYYGSTVPLNPGVVSTLLALRDAGVVMAIGSSTPKRLVELSLLHHGIVGFFKRVVTADEVEHGKPAPDIFLRALSFLGVPASDAIVVEDSRPGLIAARAAGIRAVWVRNEFQPEAEEMADEIINGVPDLLKMM
jgi:HAD superfamily hydrolase (TIGR01509 family)